MNISRRSLFVIFTALVLAFLGACDRREGIRTSQSAGGPGNAPDSERSPVPSPAPER
jgi:hypothetical protein